MRSKPNVISCIGKPSLTADASCLQNTNGRTSASQWHIAPLLRNCDAKIRQQKTTLSV
ncbi:MAG: hypothetical protein ACI3Z5_01755 [Paludibacteraceae bacterium]